jgi:hypothetical protein
VSICDAIRSMQTLSFTYNGFRRVVEPHAYGIDTKGHEALRAFQTTGGSECQRNARLVHATNHILRAAPRIQAR